MNDSEVESYTNDQGLVAVLKTKRGAKRALVIGDPMYDIYWIGQVTGISAEVPIPKVTCKKGHVKYMPGGAANVMANLRGLNVNALMVYPDEGQRPEKNRLMVDDYQMARWDYHDSCPPIDPRDILRMVKVHRPDAIVVADYNKGGIDGPTLQAIDDISKDLPIYVDTKRDPALYPEKACFFPNQTEYDQFPFEYTNAERCILKQGPQGMQFLEKGEVMGSVEALVRYPVCVNGAGDTVMAAFVSAELQKEASPLYYAAVAAAVAVSTPYTTIVSSSGVDKLSKQLSSL